MDKQLKSVLDDAPWWAKLLVMAGVSFGTGYLIGGVPGGIATLITWAGGVASERPIDTIRRQKNGG